MLAGPPLAVEHAHAQARIAMRTEHLRRWNPVRDRCALAGIELRHLDAPARRIAAAQGGGIDLPGIFRGRRQDILGTKDAVLRILPERPVAARLAGRP
jgi:hypothetical protein